MDEIFFALRVLVSLGVVLAVIVVLQRRLTRGSVRRAVPVAVRVVGRQALGHKASAVVVETGERRLLLGVTEHGVTVLRDDEVADAFGGALAVATAASIAGDHASASIDRAAASVIALPTPAARLPVPAQHGSHRGDLLSAEPWKRSLTALRQGLLR